MKKTKSKPAKKRAQSRHHSKTQQKLPFIEHFRELRQRLVIVAVAVLGGGVVAYQFNKQITDFLVWPAGDQQFIFTSPAGGFEFLFRLCFTAGVAVSIPVIMFQLLRYLQPLVPYNAMRLTIWGTVASAVLAAFGIVFGYFIGLPPALNFLLQNFLSDHVEALITIQSYMSFVTMYLLGAALIFQLPLVLLFINRIKPLKPSKLFKQQRWVILIAFIAAAIITPTPDIPSLLVLALPMIFMYQLGIGLVWLANRKHHRPAQLTEMRQRDAELQRERLERFQQAHALWRQTAQAKQQAAPLQVATTPPSHAPTVQQPARSRQYAGDGVVRRPNGPLLRRRSFGVDNSATA